MYVAVGEGFVKVRYLTVKRIYLSFCGKDAAILMYRSGWGLVCYSPHVVFIITVLFLVD
jgi:hypothetical protein